MRGQEGQALPLLLMLMLALAGSGVLFLQAGRGAVLRSQGQTAADAATLAAGVALRRELERTLLTTGAVNWGLVDWGSVRAAAERYARANAAAVVPGSFGFDPMTGEVWLTTRTLDSLGDDGARVGRRDLRARAKGAARLTLSFAYGSPAFVPGLGGPASGPSMGGLPAAELAELAAAAGVRVRADSALRRYSPSQCAGSAVHVGGLTKAMKVAILRAEDLLGHGLSLSDAFRTRYCQTIVPATNSCGCKAPPGTSMHEFGMAIDVNSVHQGPLKAIAAQVGLCHPIPADEPHFSLSSGRECGGRGGALGPGGAYGGDPGSLVSFELRLVEHRH